MEQCCRPARRSKNRLPCSPSSAGQISGNLLYFHLSFTSLTRMRYAANAIAFLMLFLGVRLDADPAWTPTWPKALESRTWLDTHSRLCFDVTEKTLDEI